MSAEHPVVISSFETNAREVEIDAVAESGKLVVWAICEHIENAGVHSGDATLVLPPQTLYLPTIRRVRQIAGLLAEALQITGPFNVQFIAKNNVVKVIECNLRASRSFPFISKVLGHNFAAEAMGEFLAKKQYSYGGLVYNETLFPQDVRNCTKCHDGSATSTAQTAQGDNWKNAPSRRACGGCHDGVNFATGMGVTIADALEGLTETTRFNGLAHGGGAQPDDSTCTQCHTPDNIDKAHLPVTPPNPNSALHITGPDANANTNAAWVASNTSRLPAGAIKVTYEIRKVSRNATKQPVMEFRMTQDETFLPYTINSTLTTQPLPRSSLDGRVDTLSGNLKLTSVLTDKIRINAALTYDDRDNRTPRALYEWITTDTTAATPRSNLPYSFTRSVAKADGTYAMAPDVRIDAGCEFDEYKRDLQEVSKTHEGSCWGKATIHAKEQADIMLMWTHGRSARDLRSAANPARSQVRHRSGAGSRRLIAIGSARCFLGKHHDVTGGLTHDHFRGAIERLSLGQHILDTFEDRFEAAQVVDIEIKELPAARHFVLERRNVFSDAAEGLVHGFRVAQVLSRSSARWRDRTAAACGALHRADHRNQLRPARCACGSH